MVGFKGRGAPLHPGYNTRHDPLWLSETGEDAMSRGTFRIQSVIQMPTKYLTGVRSALPFHLQR